MKYRIAYLKIDDKEPVPYLSDYVLNNKDIVMIEGSTETYEVIKVNEFDNLSMPYDLSKLKKITAIINKDSLDLRIEVNALPVFSYLDYHTDILIRKKDDVNKSTLSFIQSLKIKNETDSSYNNLKIKFEFSNPALKINDIELDEIKAHTEEPLRNPIIYVDIEKLKEINEIKTETLEIRLEENDEIISEIHHIFTLLPINVPSIEARYDNRLYIKYINPFNYQIEELKNQLIEKYGEIKAYKNNLNNIKNEINNIYEFIKELYFKIDENGISFKDELYSNIVKLDKDLLNEKAGTSLDLSLLISALLLNLGYNPILIMTKTNATVGVYLKDRDELSKNIFDDGSLSSHNILYNYVTGTDDLILFNLFNNESLNLSLEENIKSINNYIYSYDNIFYAYDLRYLENGVFNPILIGEDNEFNNTLLSLEKNDKKEVIREVKFIEPKEEIIKDRFTFWEKKLLDLSEANPLVNFNIKVTNSIRLTSNEDFDQLLLDKNQIKLDTPIKACKDLDLEYILNSNKRPKDLANVLDGVVSFGDEKTLKSLISKSKSASEETGAPTLYLIMGLLRYKRLNNTNGAAPFMVLPVKIIKNKNKSGYTMSYDYEDLMINQTFFEYYSEFNPDTDYSSLYNIQGERYIDVCHTFKVINNNEITLDSDMFILANLTFSHYIMWLDMKKRKEELKKNKVVESIIENRNMLNDVDLSFDMSIDDLEDYSHFCAPLPYDSTQLKAILDCVNGKSFILDGPPGTGKSQTIVNMITNAFFNGKTVLFVAEKKAALDVVYDRLKRLKLDRFALELHSNKANKADFFAKLKSSMEIGRTVDSNNFEESANDLLIKKVELKEAVNKMHNKKYFMSLYDAITITEYNDSNPLELNMNYLINYDDKKDKEIKKLLDDIKAISKEIPEFRTTPLKYVGLASANFFEINNIKNDFSKIQEIYDDLIYEINRFMSRIGISLDLNQDIILELLNGINISLTKDIYSDNLHKFFNEYNKELVNELFNKALEINKFENEFNYFKFNEILNINAKEYIDLLNNTTGFFKKLSLKKKCKKLLKNVVDNKVNNDLINYFNNIDKYQELYNFIKNNSDELNNLLGINLINDYKNIDEIISKYNNTLDLSNIINNLNNLEIYDMMPVFIKLNQDKEKELIDDILKINNDSDNYSKEEENLTKKYNIRYNLLDMDSYNKLLSYMGNDLEKSWLIAMAKINEFINKLNNLGLEIVVDKIIKGEIDINDVLNIYEKSLADGYIRIYFMDDDINYFNPSLFDSEINKYRNLINDYNNYAIEEASARLSKKLIHDSINYMESSPIGRLKKSIQSSGRGTTIRETLRDYDNVIKSYFPVFLMSPLSVAQYLAMDDEFGKGVSKFDIVIFDEASQIPTHEAIGSIARGNSLIVSGDPNQMPPSSYFQTGITISDDDMEFEDADSLLNECLAISLPRHRLKFHYRSHHESLIQFSNMNFYDSSLYTFPSVDSDDFKVEFEYVAPKEEKKNSSMSNSESDAIINRIKEIYENPLNHGKSLGIIVFNITQEEVLENRLQSFLLKNPHIREELAYSEEKTSEPYFIKSLENVQGDERDIIILSIGFRKNALGHPYINGPLVRVNGEKRLNVAVSRSKDYMYIISTIRFSDFEADERITSLGAKTLKRFLGYAEFKSFNSRINESDKEMLAKLISEDLKEYGIESECGIGSGSVKVDLAIKKKDSNLYSLGVLIDNSVASDDLSLRDRLYVNEYVLNNLKWNVINIYSVEIFKNRKAVIDKIIKALDDPYVKANIKINPNIIMEQKEDITIKPLEYMKAVLVRCKYDKERGFSNLDVNLKSIVSIEGPVSFSRIKKIIRDNYGLKSITKSMSDMIEEKLIKDYFYTIDQQGERFFTTVQSTYMSGFRYALDRDVYEVSKEELAACMREILKIQGDLDLDDLFKALLKAFEFDTKVLNKRIRERLEYAYEFGQKERLI